MPQIYQEDSNTAIPLKQVGFNVEVNQGFADFVLHQLYENNEDAPLEIVFKMPLSDTFTLNQIVIDFTLEDGKKKQIVTKVADRQKAEEQYEDKVAQGKTALLATLPAVRQDYQMLTVKMGNMPPKSTAYLRAYCHQ